MKKVKRRTVLLLVVVFLLVAGLLFYIYRLAAHGEEWASFISNESVYTDGNLSVGTVLDRNGVLLSGVSDGNRFFSDDWLTRVSTLHAVGDVAGNIGTGALSAFASKLIGYNFFTGTYSRSAQGHNLYLTIDSDLNKTAYEALDGRNGVVAVYNYETGEVVCMVSAPSYDPTSPPDAETAASMDGVYINRFLSSSYTPGSIFKLVTTTAALETMPDIYEHVFYCEGSFDIGEDTVTCTGEHGDVTLEDALAASCNCAFAQLALELGPDTIEKYTKELGLTEEFSIDGIKTAAGNFEKAGTETADLAWSGIGQYKNTVNPAAMLRLMGAIANDGKAVEPKLIKKETFSNGFPAAFTGRPKTKQLLSYNTAQELSSMMNYNVSKTYGTDNFPGLELYAKSGTAEVGDGQDPHAWFVGYIKNEDYPLAFVVLVENGGTGSSVAGTVANTVLQSAVYGD